MADIAHLYWSFSVALLVLAVPLTVRFLYWTFSFRTAEEHDAQMTAHEERAAYTRYGHWPATLDWVLFKLFPHLERKYTGESLMDFNRRKRRGS